MFFKVLGILLFAVEIWWFIGRPIVRELIVWLKRGRGGRLNVRTLVTLSCLCVLMMLMLVPWRTSVHAPALMAADMRVRLFSQVPGRVITVLVKPGDRVQEGDILITFASPDIAYKLGQAQRRVASLQAEIQSASQEPELQSRAQVLAHALEGAEAELAAATAEYDRLVIRASISGIIVEMAEPLGVGEWVKPGELLGVVADISGTRIDAYVEEAELDRIVPGVQGVFVPADLALSRIPAKVASIDGTAVRTLADQELASVNGGAIATRAGPNETLVPEVPIYRVTLRPSESVVLQHTVAGNVILEGRPASIAGQMWRKIVSVLIRESGF